MGREEQGISASHGRYHVVPRVLCFVMHGDDLLLLRGGPHKRLWAGRYNGVGGHVEPGEDVFGAALREIKEETGLDVHDLRLRGVVHADAGDPILGVLFFVFTASSATRMVMASDEGALEWWPLTRLPGQDMIEDLPVLLARITSMPRGDQPFFACYTYDEKNSLVITFAESR